MKKALEYAGRRGRNPRRRGAAAMEMALALPVLLIMIMGLLELGNMLFIRTTISKAAEFGARYAVTGRGIEDGTRLAEIKAEARRLAEALGPERISVAVRSYRHYNVNTPAQEDDAGQPCELVEVEVNCDYNPVTPFLAGALPETMTFTGRKRMVNEPWMPCD